jgi:hypothetical protein
MGRLLKLRLDSHAFAGASGQMHRRPGNDEAFGPAEDGAAGEQDRD